jgi:cysteinyl-tRNA synthetase
MNLTDVDDKTIRRSQEEKIPLRSFTMKYIQEFFKDLETLNISKAETFPRATDHIPEMVELVKTLLEKDIAYKTEDGIYFNINKFKEYGKLSKVDLENMKRGGRCASDSYDKENINDFALWKFWDKEDGDAFWETDIGKGRPGWHLECSVMSMKYLGESFDIHTGGVDLIFPHHENEIAQSEAATGKQFVKYWIHNEYILVEGKKMSKSLGNFFTLRDILDKGYNPKAIRYLLLSAHYRTQFNFSFDALEAADKAISRLLEFMDNLSHIKDKDKQESPVENEAVNELLNTVKKEFEENMDDDLNIAGALASIFEFVKKVNVLMNSDKLTVGSATAITDTMEKFDIVLGVLEEEKQEIPKDVKTLAEKREEARKAKKWDESDKLRDQIQELGYTVADTKDGFILKKL